MNVLLCWIFSGSSGFSSIIILSSISCSTNSESVSVGELVYVFCLWEK